MKDLYRSQETIAKLLFQRQKLSVLNSFRAIAS